MEFNDPMNANHWMQFESSDGIPYYYNLSTNLSQWEKPESLKNEEEKRQENFEWQELQTRDGKTFYVNFKLKKTQWRLPQELKAYRYIQHYKDKNKSKRNNRFRK
jgi:pre-mRNA-processing factor 40